ncbi:MAG: hypothetical protein AB7E14_12215, partial [Citrobacter sp.]|uniref:hypothetical protein n=1 Tax=Citrobacter sp. TaxID=1896336 RepID=UPI003D0D9659
IKLFIARSLMWVKKEGRWGCRLENIVVVRGYPLNAHFCQCLAHFSTMLEKSDQFAHNQGVVIR